MIIGEMLTTGAAAESPWFRRFGNAATFFCQVISRTEVINEEGQTATAQLTVDVQTKNLEDADTSAATMGSVTTSTEGVFSVRTVGFKELVRFVYSVAYDPAEPPPEATGSVHFRMLPPAWEDNCVEESNLVSKVLEKEVQQEAS